MKKKTAYLGVMLALALICSYVEVLIPFSIGIPGIKLGLANIVIVFALYSLGTKEAYILSIARVLLKDPVLFIFDEATASLDSISESKIQEAIDPIIHSRTSILIAHRLSTILAADEILVIKDGVIAERGVHADLVKMGGIYTELYETQFGKALDA